MSQFYNIVVTDTTEKVILYIFSTLADFLKPVSKDDKYSSDEI